LNQPQGVAYDEAQDRLYIADTLNSRIMEVFSAGHANVPQFLNFPGATSGSLLGQFNQPAGIAVDRAGNIYVADTRNNRIQFHTNAQGWQIFANATQGTTLGKVNQPSGIYVDGIVGSKNMVIVADTGNNRIQINTGNSATGWSLFMNSG